MSEFSAKTVRIALLEWRALEAIERVSALAVPAMFGVVFLMALWLHPDPRGLGTHQQLGLPPCTFQAVLHIPCPTCGMTTAVSLMAHGRAVEAFFCQPAGACLFVGGALTSAACLLFGCWGRQPTGLGRLVGHKAMWITGLAILGAAWIYKIVHSV